MMIITAACRCGRFLDPASEVKRTDITRFPRAVLEVELLLPEGT
jgi:hypothetical protein